MSEAHFGDDLEEPYESWVNYGTNIARDVHIKARQVQNMGVIDTVASLKVEAEDLILQDGKLLAGQSLLLKARNLKMRSQTNTVGAELILDVSGVLTDGGAGAEVIFETQRGIRLERKPAWGDLLGT